MTIRRRCRRHGRSYSDSTSTMKFLFDADDDWQERLRHFLYPRLHPLLARFGGYGVGHVGENQYVGVVGETEEVIEEEFVAAGGERNPIAAFKSLADGRTSEGSWRFTHASRPDLVEPGMQLHFTFFQRTDAKRGRKLYAHYEDDWAADALGHLRSNNFSTERGVELGRRVVREDTFLTLH